MASAFAEEPGKPQETSDASPDVPPTTALYLHLLAPRYYTDPPTPARRIVSTRIWLSKEFAVTIEDAPEATLAGRIDRVDGEFVVHELWGTHNSSKNWFKGVLELEKPAYPTFGMFSGAMWSTVFVLSTNSDCQPLLKKIDPENR